MYPIDHKAEFISNARWVTRAKVQLGVALFLVLAYGYMVGLLVFNLKLLSILVALEIFINIPHDRMMQRMHRPVRLFAATSAIDIVIITFGAYLLGDIGKLLALLTYPMAAIFAGVVMAPRSTFIYANLSVVCLGTLILLESRNWIPQAGPMMLPLDGWERAYILVAVFVLYNFQAYFVCYLSNIFRKREKQLVQSVFYDQQTGLPSRELFLERLQQAMARVARAQESKSKSPRYSVILLDLDRFKVISNGLGQDIARELLIETGARLKTCLKEADTVAYMGGDKFAILLEAPRSPSVSVRVSERIQEALSLPFKIRSHDIFTSISIGIALGLKNYSTTDEIMRDAHTALAQAKESGQGQHKLFDARTRPQLLARMEMETKLRIAIKEKQFRLYYQPIISLQNNALVGFEALIRWPHPDGGFIGPDEFIPIAEETGMITQIDPWVVVEACRQLAAWQAEFPRRSLPTISVNASAECLKERKYTKTILNALAESGVPAGHLKVEITESILIDDPDTVMKEIATLNDHGIEFCIDDFGTGYSSLSYLRRLNMAKLKIDRSFVSRLTHSEKDMEIIKNIIVLAHDLKLEVIAEGVELPQHIDLLKALGCDFAQGFYYSKPISPEAATSLLADNKSLV